MTTPSTRPDAASSSPVPMRTEPVAAPDAEWRRLGRFLWAGRRDDRPIGTIERGRRYVLTDALGEPVGGYRTLEEAQAAALLPPALRTAVRRPVRRSAAPQLLPAVLLLAAGAALSPGALAVLGLA